MWQKRTFLRLTLVEQYWTIDWPDMLDKITRAVGMLCARVRHRSDDAVNWNCPKKERTIPSSENHRFTLQLRNGHASWITDNCHHLVPSLQTGHMRLAYKRLSWIKKYVKIIDVLAFHFHCNTLIIGICRWLPIPSSFSFLILSTSYPLVCCKTNYQSTYYYPWMYF